MSEAKTTVDEIVGTMPKKAALKAPEACEYVGGVSAGHFSRITRRYGLKPTVFGTWSVEKLDELCQRPGKWVSRNRKKAA